MQLLFVLNRVQDLLGLPRTTTSSYPVNTDPLHTDEILVEDIWEATKTVTLDQSRRGSAQISEVYHSVVKDQADYPLPVNCCKLLDVEYVSSRNPKAQLDFVSYDQLVKYQDSSFSGIPSCYSLSESSSRKVLISATADSAGMVHYHTKGSNPLTATVDGTQIDVGDYIFNKTTKAEGEVSMLESLYPILSIVTTNSASSGYVYIETPTFNRGSNSVGFVLPVGNEIKIEQRNSTHFSTQHMSSIVAGDIIYDAVRGAWLIITKAEHNAISNYVMLDTEGFVRGNSMSINELLSGYSDGDSNQSVSGQGQVALTNANIHIGKADLLNISSGNILVSDASEGMTGGISKLDQTKTGLSNNLFLYSDGKNIITDLDLTTDVDYIGSANTKNQTSNPGVDDGEYTGYYFFLKDSNGIEYPGYIGTQSSPIDQANWGSTWGLITGTKYHYLLYSDVFLKNEISTSISSTVEIVSYSVYRENFISGDSVQIEQRVPTLDAVTLFPIPDSSDAVGTENLRFVYYAFPSQPKHIRSPIGLPESYSDALISKAFEIAKRRETGVVEPYNFSLHRSTSGRRHLPNAPVRRRPVAPGLYTNVPIN